MKKYDDMGKDRGGSPSVGTPEREKEWCPPRLTIWEVARDTTMGTPNTKTGSGADSLGMRDVTT
jgi:hypothetical protein